MINKKFMILTIFLVSLLAVSAVSAADNATEDIVGVEETDTVVSVENNDAFLKENNNVGTFSDLEKEIANAKSQLTLTRDYINDEWFFNRRILIDKSIIINGNGHTINGNDQSGIFHIKSSNVVLNNLYIVNSKTESSGGAIYWEGSNGILSNCKFENTTADRDDSSGHPARGGAVYFEGDDNKIYNCSFVNSHAYNGGGAISLYGSNVHLSDCSFVNCDSKWAHDYSNEGGAVYWQGSNGVLSNCSFVNCRSSYNGGSIFCNGINNLISWCSFENSEASESKGGAIYLIGDECILSDCNFVDSTSGYGGDVYWDGSNAILANCNFTDSYVSKYFDPWMAKFYRGDGGSIYLDGDYNKLYNCNFVNSHTEFDPTTSGGAVEWDGSNGNLSDCSFVNCGSEYGGAVHWYGDNSILSDCSFVNCRAEYGGGIYFAGEDCSLIYPTFEGNSATYGPDWYSEQPLIVIINDTKTSTVITAPSVTINYGVSKNLIATLKDINNNILVGEKISIVLNNKEQTLTTNSKGQVSLAIPTNLAPKTYVATIKYAGNDKYDSSSTITNVIVNKASTALTASDVVADYNSGKYFTATLKDVSGKVISGAKVTIKLGKTTKTLTTNSNGQVSLTTDGLIPDTYVAAISFEGNDVYDKSSTTAKVTVNKLDTKLTARYDANSKNIVATVKDNNGNPIKGLRVGFALNGVKYVTTDANGQAKYSTAGLADGTYKVTVQASRNEIYKDSNKETVTFSIGSKEMSKIFLRNALYFVTQTKLVQVTLWDGNNQPLAGKTVYIRAYDSVWHGVTDENGDAFVRVGIGFGTHDATVSFDGDDQYFGSEKAGYIRVIKQTPSVMVRGADTMFKATNPVKIVKVHLRDRYDQPLPEGSKIVLKLNGKTYIGFTDSEGVARIAININTVGTFTAQAMYGGNSAYNPVTRDVKIRIV